MGGGTIGIIKSDILDPLTRATEVKDKRLAALNVYKGINNVRMGKNLEKKLDKETDNIKLNIGLGSSSSKYVSQGQATIAKGSNVNAGGDVNITATKKNVNIHGSNVSGNNVTLRAKENVNITAAENTSTNNAHSSNHSVGAGVSLGIGRNASGVSGYFNASAAQGKENSDTTTYSQSTVTARDKLTINSGKDTSLVGSQVKGDKFEANIGGNLNIESKQDRNTYNESSSSAGIGLSSSGVSGGASTGKMKSDYASVTKQAGIYAGKKGFNINVKGNTDLKGAVIDSTATSEKNKLITGTLSFSDIENKADYSAGGVGVNLDTSAGAERKDAGLTPNLGMPAKGAASSTTKSGVAAGTITITNKDKQKQDISALNRDPTNTLNKLGEIFNKETVQERQELASLFGELAYNEIHRIADRNGWKESSAEKNALHAVVGGIVSKLTGSGFISGASGAMVNEMVQNELKKIKNPALHQWASAAVGMATAKIISANMLASAEVAVSGTRNNYLKENVMPKEVRVIIFPQAIGTADMIPHVCLEFIYPDGAGNEELHFGAYVKATLNGPGTILDTNSSIYVDSSLKTGRAYIYETIKDTSAINDIVAQANAFMKNSNETKGNGSLRKDVLARYNDEDVDAYYSNNKYFGRYNALNNNCLSFVKAVVGKHGKIKNANNFIFW